jgi:hypothetical protein
MVYRRAVAAVVAWSRSELAGPWGKQRMRGAIPFGVAWLRHSHRCDSRLFPFLYWPVKV